MPYMADKRRVRKTGEPNQPRDMHTISLTAEEYQQLKELADRNSRPLIWQVRLILHAALKAEGLWPPPADPED